MVRCWVGLAYGGVAGSLAGRFWCFGRCIIGMCLYNDLDCVFRYSRNQSEVWTVATELDRRHYIQSVFA